MRIDSTKVHSTFAEFMQKVALPMHLENPAHVRLDGRATGGNWDVTGRFRWNDRVWKVHSDSQYEPLLLAYYSWHHLLHDTTFVEASMKNAQRLDLAPSLAAVRPVKPRHLYIYEDM